MKLKLVSVKSEIPGVKTFIWEPAKKIEWQAGQFMYYDLPHKNEDDRGERRWFTISAPPYAGQPTITTRIASDKGSSFKNALLDLNVGAEIEADPPEGDFVVEDPQQDYIFVAGGIGITPFHSIICQLDHDSQPLNVDLMYANRDEDFIFKAEFEAVQKRHPEFKIHYFTGDKKIEADDLKLLINQKPNAIIYVSGPEPMVEHYVEVLKGMDIPEDQIKTDYFPGYEFAG